MDKQAIERAATALVQARKDMKPLSGLPQGTSPQTVDDAHAIQDAVTAALGKPVAAFKAMAPANGEPTRGVIYAGTVLASPAGLPVSQAPQCGVEAEVAFLFDKALPPRATPYTREEIAAAVRPVAAIEVVHSRFAMDATVSTLDKLADSISNAALVYSEPKADWRGLNLGQLKVTLLVNGEPVLDQVGGHPTGDPLGVATVLVNLWREKGGVQAGQFVTCGSFTGLRYVKPGDSCGARFEGLGAADVVFTV